MMENSTLVCIIEPDEKLNKQIESVLSQQKFNIKWFLDIQNAIDFMFTWKSGILLLINWDLYKENEGRISEILRFYKDRISIIKMARDMVEDNGRKVFCIGNDVIVKNNCFFNVLPFFVDKSIEQLNLNQRISKIEGELKESLDRYRLVVEGSSDSIFDWNIKNDTFFYSSQYKESLGLSSEYKFESIRDWVRLLHPDDKVRVLSRLREYLGRKIDSFSVEYRIMHKNGEYKWMMTKGLAIWDSKGKPIRIAGSHTDITERKIQESQLHELAYKDKVTGLNNRAYFLEKIDKVIEENKDGQQFAILFIDIDKFKEVNDTLGHDAGDLLLRDVSNILKNHIGKEDILARIGGDEFIILKRIKENIAEIMHFCLEIQDIFIEPWIINEHKFYITLSIGIAIYPRDGIDRKTLMKNADMAMYRAKDLGRNKYVFFNSYIDKKLVSKVETRSNLKAALKNEEFVLYYQPLIDVVTKRTIGAEALIRWKHPVKGIIMPGEFIQEAEDSGLIMPITEWVLKTVIKQLKEWESKGYELIPISINISALGFKQRNFAEDLRKCIDEAGISKDLLEIEITESTLLKDISHTQVVLKKLNDMGIKVYLDDFGTGYSSLSYLTKLPICGIKIDRGLVEDIPYNKRQTAVVKSLIDLAKELNLIVTAEGVEKQEQTQFLETYRLNRFQGYLYSRPLPGDEFQSWLNKGN